MGELHPFLQGFRDEHSLILAALRQSYARQAWPEFFSLCSSLVNAGVEKREELFLFSAIAQKAEITAGGPLCMLYYGMHMQSPPLSASAAACDEPVVDPRTKINSTRKPFYEAGSPVCIPIEDHMALEQILNGAKRETETQKLEILATIYMRILQAHFEKEDCCLLPMSQSLLTPQELDLWSERSDAWKARQTK